MSKSATALAALLVLTACGFQPLYGAAQTGPNGESPLQSVAVPPIPERLGQMLRIELTNRLSPKGAPQTPDYVLDVKLREVVQNLGFRKDATATRANLNITAEFVLIDARTQQPVFDGTVRSINSYNILTENFATLTAESDARRRAAVDLATEIQSRLGLFLAKPTSS